MPIEVMFKGGSSDLSYLYDIEEQEQLYLALLEDIHHNPRFYLDNLQKMKTFRVSWKDYRYNNPVLPYSFTGKQQKKSKNEESL